MTGGECSEALMQIRTIVGGADERRADRKLTAGERERAADTAQANTLLQRLDGQGGCGAAPWDQVSDFALGKRACRGRGVERHWHGRGLHRDGRRARHELDVVDVRQIPCRDVVDLIRLSSRAPLLLPLDEVLRLLRFRIEQVADQPTGRLRVRDEVAARRHVAIPHFEALLGAAYFDALRGNGTRQPVGA